MKTTLITLFAASVLFVVACSDDNNEDTVREKLTGKNWVVTKGGFDGNGNGVPDGSELQPADTNFQISGIMNNNGTGFINFRVADTAGSASFYWNLDPSNTYINSNIPDLNRTVVSKLLNVTSDNLSLVVDTSAGTKLFAYFERQ